MNQEQKMNQSPYQRGARYGAYFGLYLTFMFFAFAFAPMVPMLSVVSLVLMAGVPVLIYIFLRRSYIDDYCKTVFSSLWMEGIAIFFCGSLISSLVAVAYMTWINPGYINGLVDTLIASYNAVDWDRGKEFADILERARAQHLIPSPVQLAVDMIWLIVFSGSILSMLMALLVQARGSVKKIRK